MYREATDTSRTSPSGGEEGPPRDTERRGGVVNGDTELTYGGDCSGEATTTSLVPGQDLYEVRFFPVGPHDEFPVFREVVMGCPPPED